MISKESYNKYLIYSNPLFQVNGGCESYKLISGLDEMAIPAEIGLYFDFNVTEDGVPYGCPGLEIFDPVHWNMSRSHTGLFLELTILIILKKLLILD